MYIDWICKAVLSIASICVSVALIECICSEKEFQNGLHFVCGVLIASALIRSALDCIQAFL